MREEKKLRDQYRTFQEDPFPEDLTFQFGAHRLAFRKRVWRVPSENGESAVKGLRYGDNPEQPAALYGLESCEVELPGVKLVQPGFGLLGSLKEKDLLQVGKGPGKTNLTDIDSAILILRYLTSEPTCAIMKHNNPCAVACGGDCAEALRRAYEADPLAAFGGTVVLNRPVNKEAAEFLQSIFVEVLVAPEYEEGTLDILRKRKSLRIIRLERLGDLSDLCLLYTSPSPRD